MDTSDYVGDGLDDSGINSTNEMESKDHIPEKTIDIELAKQLGMMTLKNIIQETQGQVIPLQDLCNQFAIKAEKKEKEAVGREIAEVLVAMKEFPDIFVILEGDKDRLDEGEVNVQLTDEPGIPSLLSGVLKIKGILRDKGKLNVRDLSGIFSESCTLEEKEAVGGNSEFLFKETLLALTGIFHVTGEMVSMDVNAEPDENGSKGYADIENQSSTIEHEVDVKGSALSGKMEGTQSNMADNTAEEVICKGDEEMEDQPCVKLGGQQNHQQPETNELEHTQSDTIEDELEKPSDESGDQNHQPPEKNVEYEQIQSDASEDEVEKPSDESSAVNGNEPQQQQDDMQEMSSDQETLSNIKVGEVKEQSDEIDEEDTEIQKENTNMEDHLDQLNTTEPDTQEVSDVEKQVDGQQSSSNTSSSLNGDSSNHVSVSSASATAVEQKVDIPSMLAKQLGIMKIKQMLTERGSVSLQVLSSAFGNKGTTEERDAVGRKACEILQTLQQFNDVFAFERFPEKGGALYEQEYVSLKGDDNETSLAFARAVLKIPDILEEKGNLAVTQLSTFLNQNSTLDERTAVGRNPASLKETLSALPRLFHFSDEKVYVMKAKQSTKKVESELQTQAASASAKATNFANHFDCTFVYQHLGVLMLREILEERGELSLQLLCGHFGQRADDNEREAVGWRAMVVLETLKEYPDIFNIKLPKNVTVQSVVNETKVSLKGSAANKTSVPYARAMFKLIWFLKEKGTLSVVHLSTCLRQNSTLSEREAVGKNPGTLKKTLQTFPKMFKVAGDNISVVEDAHTYAANRFVHHKKEKVPEPEYQLSISEQLRKKIVSTVIECLQLKNGSCDLDFITRRIRSHGSLKEKEIFGNNGKALMKLLKTMSTKFSFQGSHVYLVNGKDNGRSGKDNGRNGASGYGIPKYEASRALFPQAGNPIPLQGVLPKSQAKVIPSIEIMFDTKNRCENGWRDLSVTQALTTSSQTQYQVPGSSNPSWPVMSHNQQQLSSGLSTTEKIEQFYAKRSAHTFEPSQSAQQAIGGLQSTSIGTKTNQPTQAKQSGLEKITAYLEQCKITTIIQLGGVLGSKGTAAERNAVGKNPSLLYDALSSLPNKFVIVGPFVGVKSQSALVSGTAKLVTFVESKGKCEVTSLMGQLGHRGTAKEQIAIGKDIQTFIQTISAMPGVFVIDGTSVYLNNGRNGQPNAPTKMDKTTALNQNLGWALSAGTSALNSSPSVLASENDKMTLPSSSTTKSDSYASAVTASSDKQDEQTLSFTLTIVPITDQAMCQEFVQQCLAKYDYPIISLLVNKEKKWIAIAGWEEHVYFFDMERATPSAGGLSILAEVIASDKVLKVVFNCKHVSTILYECYGFKLNNIFDTKVAYQLLTGDSKITIPQLCTKYGVTNPDKWKIRMIGRGAAAKTDQKDQRLAAWARVLSPQIYQHMVMKFSEDSLKEVGKLCESFLHKGDGSATSGLSAASGSNIATPVQSPSITSSGYVDISSSSRSSDILSQANPSFGQKELTSFGATHSKVTPPTLNPWGITQQLRDQFAYRNKHDMNKLMAVLGEDITHNLTRLAESSGKNGLNMLTDITLDCGRFAQARFYQKDCPSGSIEVNVSSAPITQENIQSVLDCDWVTTPTSDRRAGIEDTLHRLGIITNRKGRAIGLTVSVGRAVLGSADHIHDLMQDGQSMVLMGSPGVGMTTVLREVARVLSDVKKRRVVIIDTYNQIGGDSDTPHTSIGSARRLQVASRTDQYKTMVEALQNHNPQTVIIDEIATAPEAQAVRNLVQRGVQVIVSARSCNFVDFLQNPEFKAVTGMVPGSVGNEGMDLGNGSKSTVLERRQEPAFKVLIELCDRDRWLVYKDLSLYIDYYLQGILHPIVQERQRTWNYSEQGTPSGSQCTVKLVEVMLPSPSPLTV